MPPRWRSPIAARGRHLPLVVFFAVCLLALVTSCGGNDNPNANQIKPINADITINPVGGDPVVYLERVDADLDLVTIDVKLRMTAAQEFDAFTLHFRFDPTLIQFAGMMQIPESDDRTFNPLGECGSVDTYCGEYPYIPGTCNTVPGTCLIETGICDIGGTDRCLNPAANNAPCTVDSQCDRGTICDSGLAIGDPCSVDAQCDVKVCDTGRIVGALCQRDADCEPGADGPLCQPAGDENVTGELFLGMGGDIDGQCYTYNSPGAVTLARLAFNATSAIEDPIDGRLELVSGSALSGDCAILRNLVDLMIACDDGGAYITASR
jgi:hypothetical protein